MIGATVNIIKRTNKQVLYFFSKLAFDFLHIYTVLGFVIVEALKMVYTSVPNALNYHIQTILASLSHDNNALSIESDTQEVISMKLQRYGRFFPLRNETILE